MKCSVFKVLSTVLSAILILSGCNRLKYKASVADEDIIKISGSNSEYELVKGLLQEFQKQNTNPSVFRYTIEGVGSEVGIEKFLKGEVDMAMSSRRMKPFEMNLLASKGIEFLEIAFAYDALAFITHYKNSPDSLSIQQVNDILSGKIINWYQVSRFKAPIKVYGRNTESGTFHFMEDKFQIPGLRKYQIACNSSREIIQKVMEDTCGFGYVSIGYILDTNLKLNKNIWPIPIYDSDAGIHQAISPLQEQYVRKNFYPVCRPLYQYFKLPLREELKKFLMYELSEDGQKEVERLGFYRINSQLQMQNNVQLMKLGTPSDKGI